ncbi:MAG: GGDEF domain-containing protein [Nitrospirota bacterium]|jgi:diguanylate cyclase (GGDEF)-like protein|nr:sensor domain-containing diguanylate cyclase [Burkholderiaceae bacterium]
MSIRQFHDFESAGKATLAFLRDRLGFGLWMVTRTEGKDWIVLQSEDHGYGVEAGHVFQWADSFCSEMIKGNGPRIAPDSDDVPAYVAAPIGRQVPIRAYIGVPLLSASGDLFGTLCAIDPERQPDAIVAEQKLIELLATLLSTILSAELRTVEEHRRSERLAVEALADPMTLLSNRRAWDQLMANEEERCRRYGHPAAVFAIDLDDLKRVNDTGGHPAGDALICLAAKTLREIAREVDVVARLGGDEFGLLAVECDSAGADLLLHRMRDAFTRRNVRASVGYSMRTPGTGLTGAWQTADTNMYAAKQAKKNPLPGTE